MGQKQVRGLAESTWHVARRCLTLINHLQQGPATKDDLIKAVYHSDDAPIDRQTAANRFEKDKERLRSRLFVSIRYDKTVKGYVLGERERPLLNLYSWEMFL